MNISTFSAHLSPDLFIEDCSINIAPHLYKHFGALHSKLKTTRAITVEMDKEGCYLGENFHERSHCQLHRSSRKIVQKICDERKIQHQLLSSAKNHIEPGSGISIVQSHTPEWKKIGAILEHLPKTEIEDRLMQQLLQNGAGERGNVAIFSGYAQQNHKHNEGEATTTPQRMNCDIFFVSLMVMMTDVIDVYCGVIKKDVFPFSLDKVRTEKFANSLPRKVGVEGQNRIEQLTIALTTVNENEEILFLSHVDQFNCSAKSFNVVFTYWYHFQKQGKVYRVAVICYSRRACSDYFNRLEFRNFLSKNIGRYLEAAKDRLDPTWGSIPSNPEEYQLLLPSFHKTRYYSAFATPVKQCLNRWTYTLREAVELLAPLLFLTTAWHYYLILREMIAEGRQAGSGFLLWFINHMVEQEGGLQRGKGPRCQPWINRSFSEGGLCKVLEKLLEVCILCRKEKISYDKAIEELTALPSVGDLGAQHFLAVGGLTGVLPIWTATEARIAKGTGTFHSLNKIYGLGISTIQNLYGAMAKEHGLFIAVMENVGCEFLRDWEDGLALFRISSYLRAIAKRKLKNGGYKWPDLVFQDQWIFYIIDNIGYYSERNQEPQSVSLLELKTGDAVFSSQTPKQEVKISTTSSEGNNGNNNKKTKKMKKRSKGWKGKKVKHSGLGGKPAKELPDSTGSSSESESEEKYAGGIGREHKLLAAATTRRTRNRDRPGLQEILGASSKEGTYVCFDLGTALRAAVGFGGQQGKRRKKKRKKNLINFDSMIHDERKTYTCYINGPRRYFLGAATFLDHGFSHMSKGLQYYSSEELAKKALVLYVLGRSSRWAEDMLRSKKFLVLNTQNSHPNGRVERVLFGCLFWRDDKVILSVPVSADLTLPWRDYVFENNEKD